MKYKTLLLLCPIYILITTLNPVQADTAEMNEIDSFWKSTNWRKENEETFHKLQSNKNTTAPSFNCYHGGIMYRDHIHTYDESIMLNTLPECNGEITSLSKHNIKLVSENDILFYHDNAPKRWSFNDYNVHEFPGKILFIVEEWRRWYMFTDMKNDENGEVIEARNNCPKHRYYIGSMADSPCSMWIPLLSMYIQDLSPSDRNKLFHPPLKPMNTKEHFLIYIASHRVKHREEAFLKLSFTTYEEVHYGGSCHGNPILSNNIQSASPFCDENEKSEYPHIVQSPYVTRRRFLDQNEQIYKHYRFSLILENANEKGYITEKIMNVFLAGSIPIWYGTTDIFDIFNPKAFIYYNVNNPQPAIDKIKFLEGNMTAYDEMLKEPILAHGEQTIRKYFSFNENIGGGIIRNRLRRLLEIDEDRSTMSDSSTYLRSG